MTEIPEVGVQLRVAGNTALVCVTVCKGGGGNECRRYLLT